MMQAVRSCRAGRDKYRHHAVAALRCLGRGARDIPRASRAEDLQSLHSRRNQSSAGVPGFAGRADDRRVRARIDSANNHLWVTGCGPAQKTSSILVTPVLSHNSILGQSGRASIFLGIRRLSLLTISQYSGPELD